MEAKLPPNVMLGSAVLVNRFKLPEGSDAQAEAFYSAIGKAICAWQTVEAAVSNLFTLVAESGHSQYAKPIFFSGSFRQAMKMTSIAILDKPFSGEAFSEWYSIEKGVFDCYANRNIIAHSAIVTHTLGDPPRIELLLQQDSAVIGAEMRRIHLAENKNEGIKPRDMTQSKKDRIDNLMNKKYDTAKILEFAVQFEELEKQIAAFDSHLRSPAQRAAFPQPRN
jgi:hypothetical protein